LIAVPSLKALTYPYQLIAPVVPSLLAGALLYLVVCLVLALVAATADPRRSGAAAMIAAAAVFLSAAWLYASSSSFALLGLVLFVVGLALGGVAPSAPAATRPAPLWTGLVVIAISTALKCVALTEWPDHLNAYSAETGLWGIYTLDGHWPAGLLRGKEYDLVNGGQSPLYLPLLAIVMRLLGGTVFALRMAEVVASTALLAVLWVWLRARLLGWWAPVALAAFAFSPWHLAQSRMGTFYSASVTLGLLMLWIAERLRGDRAGRVSWWLAFGFCAGLIGYAYAPLKVLYLFFIAVSFALGISQWRAGRRGWWRGPAAAWVVFAALVAVQLGWPPRFDEMFRRDFGTLATDTSVWHKTAADQVTAETQPPSVIAANVARNLGEWWRRTWSERRILTWYAPALTIAAPAAFLLLLRGAHRIAALYFLIGMIPPLIIFPVQRRTLVLWPLVYVAGVVAARELGHLCESLVDRAWWRGLTKVVLVATLAICSIHGLRVYATTNSIVGLGTYFGPEHRLAMIREAERMLASCRVYFVNATIEEKVVVSVRLFEPARRIGRGERFEFIEYDGNYLAVPRDEPLCFFQLSRPDDGHGGDVMERLAENFRGAMLLRRWAGDGSDTLEYSVLMVSAGGAGVESREVEVREPIDIGRRGAPPPAMFQGVPAREGGYCHADEFQGSRSLTVE
jgi:hypothetical protein